MLAGHLTISDNTLHSIGVFSINWSLFEAIYCKSEASPKIIKRIEVDLGKDMESFEEAVQCFREELREFLLTRRDIIDQDSIQHYLYTEVAMRRLDKLQEDIELITNFVNEESNDFHAALLCIQRMRNNFFHGTKDFYSLDNQKGLFDSACLVLYWLCK
jgi:hypothetical protein